MTDNGHQHNEAGRQHEEQQQDRRGDTPKKLVYVVRHCTCGQRMGSTLDREEEL